MKGLAQMKMMYLLNSFLFLWASLPVGAIGFVESIRATRGCGSGCHNRFRQVSGVDSLGRSWFRIKVESVTHLYGPGGEEIFEWRGSSFPDKRYEYWFANCRSGKVADSRDGILHQEAVRSPWSVDGFAFDIPNVDSREYVTTRNDVQKWNAICQGVAGGQLRNGDYQGAKDTLEAMRSLYEKKTEQAGLHSLPSGILMGLAVVAASEGRDDFAFELMDMAYKDNFNPRWIDQWRSYEGMMAELYLAKGDLLRSRLVLRRALLAVLAAIRSISTRSYLESRSLDLRHAFGDAYSLAMTGSFGDKEDAELALYARLNLYSVQQDIDRQRAKMSSLQGGHRDAYNRLRQINDQLSMLSLDSKDKELLWRKQKSASEALMGFFPDLKPQVVELAELASALPRDGILVEYQRYFSFDIGKPKDEQWGEERYLALVLRSDQSVQSIDLGEARSIDHLIRRAVSGIEQQLVDTEQLLTAVSDRLVKPVQAVAGSATTWFVSPDGELNRLPFAALPNPQSGGWLNQALQIRLLTSGRELLRLQSSMSKTSGRTLVLADPAYDRDGSSVPDSGVALSSRGANAQQRSLDFPDQLRWDPLPATAEEGQAIAELMDAELWMQQQATAERVKHRPSPRILHLAAHAFYLPDQRVTAETLGSPRPTSLGSRGLLGSFGVMTASLQRENPMLRSGIALAGANHPNSSETDDGYLTALEMAQLDLSGTELVVVSACDSGRGDILQGEGVFGLKRAIVVAGARSSLLSLWKVDDKATAALMESFYRRLEAGEGRGAALQATQEEFRQHPIAAWRHPSVWAAFQLSGDWRPISAH